jgi:hypothetical protein
MITWFSHAVTGLARRAWLGQQVARINAARASAQLARERREVEDALDYLDGRVRERRQEYADGRGRQHSAGPR